MCHDFLSGISSSGPRIDCRVSRNNITSAAMALEHDTAGSEGEERLQIRTDRLGRQRPAKFNTIWTEIGFCFSLLASMIMAVSIISFSWWALSRLKRRETTSRQRRLKWKQKLSRCRLLRAKMRWWKSTRRLERTACQGKNCIH